MAQQLSDREVLERFVRRARRVAAHSLAQPRTSLEKYARGLLDMNIDLANNVVLSVDLPDEEPFESLVARLRPLTVKSEPIFHMKVLNALSRELKDATESERARLKALKTEWRRTEIQGTQIQGYAVQAIRGDKPTSVVSDTQLAAGWLYADLVHADPTGVKADALDHSLRDRFTAAVRIFSRIALLTLSTFDLIESLQRDKRLHLHVDVWSEPVVITDEERPVMSRVYRAPLGTSVPAITDSAVGEHGSWTELTLSEILREEPRNQVSVTLLSGDVEEVIDAAVLSRRKIDQALVWDVLVDGCAIFTFKFGLDASNLKSCDLVARRYLDLTNLIKLRSTRLLRRLHEADRVTFQFVAGGSVALSMASLDVEVQQELKVVEEAIEDVTIIESITQAPIPPCNDAFDTRDRIRLRQTRLLWEGHAIRVGLANVLVTAPGDQPPQQIGIPAGHIKFAGQQVPTPMTIAFHEHLVVKPTGASDDTLPSRDYAVSAPEGESLFAWSPDRVNPPPPRQISITPWSLMDVDEARFLGLG